jgi:glycosyltransferase involved in cell wall biosynthesis
MNIWLISKYQAPPHYAKGLSRLFYFAREFTKLGHHATLITSDSNHFSDYPETKNVYNREGKDGVDIRWIKTKKYRKTASVARVLSWFDFERKLYSMKLKDMDKPDVVIVSSISIFSIVYGLYLKRKFKAFLIFEIRDIWPLTMTEEGSFSRWHPLVLLIGFIEKFGDRKADLIVGTMPRLDLHVKNILGYDKPTLCIPMGFVPENYLQETTDHENPFHYLAPENKVIVGYVGSMGITNALDSFIETIKLASKQQTNIHFLLVGSGDLKECLREQLKEYNNVTFVDRIPQNKVKDFLDVCDILFLSTFHSKVWEYGQSMNKVLEYMLAAKPIIASYSGYPSMINEAGCGKFVNSENPEDLLNAILEYVNIPKEQRAHIGMKGREWVYDERKYSHLAKKYLEAINKI